MVTQNQSKINASVPKRGKGTVPKINKINMGLLQK